MECILCGNKKLDLVTTKLRDDKLGSVFHCSPCDFGMLDDHSSLKELRNWYDGNYRKEHRPMLSKENKYESIFEFYVHHQRQRINFLKPYLSANTRLLDVGCSTGQFIWSIKGFINEAVGTDYDTGAASFAQKVTGCDVFGGELEESPFNHESFDVVAAIHVLEHTFDPVYFMNNIKDYVKTDGVVYIEVPNMDDALLKVYDRQTFKTIFYHTAHRWYFTPKSLAKIMEIAGFEGEIVFLNMYNMLNHIQWALVDKMNPFLEIAGRKVGLDYDTMVVAEIGINHGGSLDVAYKMVDAAVEAGVEIVKHQTHIAEDEMSCEAKQVIPGHTKESIFDIIASCALSEDEEIRLQEYVRSKGLIFFSSAFSRAAANRLHKMDVPVYKIGSGECNNYPLLEHIASFGKPIIMSTGMNTIESITKAVNIFKKHNIQYALLHCTNIYPTPPHLVRLGAITELMSEFPNAVVGLSDHTTSNYSCFGAVALGASILERHFTDSMEREGPDIICSMDPDACRELIHGSKIIQHERGGQKGPVAEEKPTIDFAYASVVTIKMIKKGELFTKDNTWVKRPGTGPILAVDFEKILGKVAIRDIQNDKQIQPEDIENW